MYQVTVCPVLNVVYPCSPGDIHPLRFSRLTCTPSLLNPSTITSSDCCIVQASVPQRAPSSVYKQTHGEISDLPPMSHCSSSCRRIALTQMLKSMGDITSPCLTPHPVVTGLPYRPPFLGTNTLSIQVPCRTAQYWGPRP